MTRAAVGDWQAPIDLSVPALVAPDEGICLYVQSGADWDRVEIRGWWKDRMFILVPECFCNSGLAELDRRLLKANRYASYDGYTYFTPDGKKAEDARNKATIAAGQMREQRFIYSHWGEGDGKVRQRKIRILNMNERFAFFNWRQFGPAYSDDIEWVELERAGRDGDGLDGHRGAFSWPCGNTYYSERGLKAREEQHKEWLREQEMWKRQRAEDAKTWIRSDDAAVLGLPLNANSETKVLAAFRRLSKIHHPDAGGSPEEFRRLCAAKDRALADLKSGGWRGGL